MYEGLLYFVYKLLLLCQLHVVAFDIGLDNYMYGLNCKFVIITCSCSCIACLHDYSICLQQNLLNYRWCHGSPVHRYGLYALQWIVEINGKPTPNIDSFVKVTKVWNLLLHGWNSLICCYLSFLPTYTFPSSPFTIQPIL